MSSLYNLYTFNPSAYNLTSNSSTGLSNQDDLAKTVENVGNSFASSVTPTTNNFNSVIPSSFAMPFSNQTSASGVLNTTNAFTQTITPNNNTDNNTVFNSSLSNPYPQDTNSADALVYTTNDIAGLLGVTDATQSNPYANGINNYNQISNDNANAGYLTVLPSSYSSINGQSIPDLGVDPNAATVLSASTQYQTNLASASGSPTTISTGYPTGVDPSALDILGNTTSYLNQIYPTTSTTAGVSTVANANQTSTLTLPSDNSYPCGASTTSTTNNNTGTSYPFASYSQFFYVPSTASNTYSSNTNTNTPSNTMATTSALANYIENSPSQLPDVLPTSDPQTAAADVYDFNGMSSYAQAFLKNQYSYHASVNTDVLSNFNITNTGGTYDRGTVNNPFTQSSSLLSTTAQSTTGLTFTGSQADVLGTTMHDVIIGANNQNDIIDGNGGQDDIIGGNGQNLIKVNPGDQVNGGSGTDIFSYDFGQSIASQTRPTVIEGGTLNNSNTLILRFNTANDASNISFTSQSNGLTGIGSDGNNPTIYVNNIQHILLTDASGNIFATYPASAGQS